MNLKLKKDSDLYTKGYKAGIADALIVIESLMENNGLHMDEKEFFIEMKNLKQEGKIASKI